VSGVAEQGRTRLRFCLDVDPAVPSALRADPDRLVSFLPMEAVGERGGLDLSREIRAGDALSGYTFVANGDVVLAKVTPCFENGKGAVASGLTNGVGFATTEVYTLRPRPSTDARFLDFTLQSAVFRQYGTARLTGAGGLKRVSATDVRNFVFVVPPLDEQRAIADFLDRETARIDTLIEEQQRLIDLLRERRQTSIDESVWCGIDGDIGVQSVIEPAPKVPVHWNRLRNKQILEEADGVSADGSEELLSVSHLTGVTPRSEKNVTMIEADSLDGYRLVEPGDLVINTMWAWMGALGVSSYSGIVSPAYGVYRPLRHAALEPRYFDYLYRSRPYVVEMTRYSRGIWSSRLRIYPEVFLRLPVPVPVPPLDEQRRIAAYLDEQTSKIDTLIAETERFIELARERRSALITAAVTGQIDVRAEVA